MGGIFGKIAQMQPELSNLMGHNQESNYSKGDNERVRLALASANSQYQGGEITSEEVVRILKASLAQSQGESAEGVNIHHIKVLGRGTIAQIDHVRINDKDYAVKTLSPRLVWA
nr:hypothetical protein [Endozoicomonas sp.]